MQASLHGIHVTNSLRVRDIQENLGKCIRSFQQLFILQRRKMQGDAKEKLYFVNCNFENLSLLNNQFYHKDANNYILKDFTTFDQAAIQMQLR